MLLSSCKQHISWRLKRRQLICYSQLDFGVLWDILNKMISIWGHEKLVLILVNSALKRLLHIVGTVFHAWRQAIFQSNDDKKENELKYIYMYIYLYL